MRVLVACEYSGVVRDAFIARGHEAVSCDLLPATAPGPHFEGDIFELLAKDMNWDLMIAHPPCTHLAVSGSRHFKNKIADGRQQAAIDFVKALWELPISRICIENPVGILSTRMCKPTQYIQPFWFGEHIGKKTGLWLKNLPNLVPTDIVVPETITNKNGKTYDKWWYETCSLPLSIRGHVRSKTFQGIADAMADQWGIL